MKRGIELSACGAGLCWGRGVNLILLGLLVGGPGGLLIRYFCAGPVSQSWFGDISDHGNRKFKRI